MALLNFSRYGAPLPLMRAAAPLLKSLIWKGQRLVEILTNHLMVHFCSNLPAIKFKVILIERRGNHETIIHGKAARVFKHGNVPIQKGRVEIWSNTNSTCPSLRAGQVFLISGHESKSRKKLLLSSTSLIEAWSGEALRKIRRWQRIEKKLGVRR